MSTVVSLLALAALGWAGGAPSTVKPVQLRLELAPSAAPAAGPSGLAPSAIAQAQLPAGAAAALKGGDAAGFHAAAVLAEYEPPISDDVQQRLLREGAESEAAERAFWELAADPGRAVQKRGARRTKIDYDEFGRLLSLTPRLSLSPFQDIEPKRRILAASGYDRLIGPGAIRIPIAIADDIRVGRAFANVLSTYRRR
mgnify:CR=1 FL=1